MYFDSLLFPVALAFKQSTMDLKILLDMLRLLLSQMSKMILLKLNTRLVTIIIIFCFRQQHFHCIIFPAHTWHLPP